MTRILAIGNSFSEDALAYLHEMAKTDGVEVECVNLYIGGCSLEQHWENARSKEKVYEYQRNGKDTGKVVSLEDALQEEWDYITLQQASHDSGCLETYYPYLEKLLEYVRGFCKEAKIYLHQTWAYETDSTHDQFVRYHNSQSEMYQALKAAYDTVHKEFSLPMIPCGEVIQSLRKRPEFDYEHGGRSLCRDGFHMDLPYGRYALAAVWYMTLLNGDLSGNKYVPQAEEAVRPELLQIIGETIKEIQERILYEKSNIF